MHSIVKKLMDNKIKIDDEVFIFFIQDLLKQLEP